MPNQYYHNNDNGRNGYQDPEVHQAINQYNNYIASNNITSTTAKREARKLFPLSKPATEGNQDLPDDGYVDGCLLYTSPSPRDATLSRMPSSA